jgi:hypothetical protein
VRLIATWAAVVGAITAALALIGAAAYRRGRSRRWRATRNSGAR